MKKKITKHHTCDINEESERLYRRKLKVDQRLFQTFLNSFQCFNFPFYLNDYTVFTQIDLQVNQPKDSKSKKSLTDEKLN